MIDQNPSNEPPQNEPAAAPPPAAFCQNCGKPLDKEGVRIVGSSVYCEPCLAARLAGNPSGVPRGASGSAPIGSAAWASSVWPPSGIGPSTPNPGLATLLGFIPGVGAMYNEQYAKGIVHLIVFAVLVSLVHANGLFLLFVFGWVFYMAFEAHHTAQARRDGTSLPNPFGLNDIGERLGFGKAWTSGPKYAPTYGHAYQPGYGPASPPASGAATSGAATPGAPPYAPSWNAHPASSAAPAQEVSGWGAPVDEYTYPPRHEERPAYGPMASASAQDSADVPAQNYTSAYGEDYGRNLASHIGASAASAPAPDPNLPYGAPMSPYGSGPYTAPPYNSTYVPPMPGDPAYMPPPSRFPAGAIWLIGLGTLFLLATTGVFNIFPGGILVGFLLIGLGIWVFLRRMFDTGVNLADNGTPGYSLRLMRAARGAVWLVLIGLLLLLNDFHILRWYRSWPLFIIVAGVLALLERVVWSSSSSALLPPASQPAPAASSASSMSVVPSRDSSDGSDQDPRKGGR